LKVEISLGLGPDAKKRKVVNLSLDIFGADNNGKTLVEIAHLRELTEGTIASHIALLFEERQLTDVSPYLTPEQQAQLAEKLEANAAEGSLTTLHEAMGKNLSFEQLRIGIAWWRNKKRWF
jgi:uncharacterized protein YpbB